MDTAETAFECMKAAYDAGINFFDTAELYEGGQAEVVLGQAIKKYGWKQNDLVISTKVGLHLYVSRLAHSGLSVYLPVCANNDSTLLI